jgi:acetylornithine deacetylase/succinyl-diaminopimelate desuccinylase-like protein
MESAPFEPVVKDGKIYARGAIDDKGQMFMHINALEVMTKTGDLRCNIKFIIEGEEETDSNRLDAFLKENKEKLSADVVLSSDTSMISREHPSIATALRSMSYMEVEVTGPDHDLPSSVYGISVLPNLFNAVPSMFRSNLTVFTEIFETFMTADLHN